MLKKYITYAKLNVFPRLHDADLDKLTQVYAELRRESSVRFPFDSFLSFSYLDCYLISYPFAYTLIVKKNLLKQIAWTRSSYSCKAHRINDTDV